MNKFDKLCFFRFADIKDADRIMNFIYTYWSNAHILANNKEFFLSEFKNGNKLNFLIAEDKEKNDIQAIMGFFVYSSDEILNETDYSGALLKVKNNSNIPLLGVEMLKRFLDMKKPRMYIGNGSNPKTALPWQKKILKHVTGNLEHYYKLNSSIEYKISKINDKIILPINSDFKCELIKYMDIKEMSLDFDLEAFKSRYPYKDKFYIQKRYFQHPIYEYLCYGVKIKNTVDMVIIAREVEQNSSKILRIVDIMGNCNSIRYIGKSIDDLILEKKYEYVDIYQYGIDELVLNDAGFINKKNTPNNIIPNYFEPFVQSNVDIYFHIPNEKCYIFKADGDQDRPNKI